MKKTVTGVVKGVDELEPSHSPGDNVKWYSCFGK